MVSVNAAGTFSIIKQMSNILILIEKHIVI